jgi:hypothetical protein
VVSWDVATGDRDQLLDAAQAAALSEDGHWLLATLDSGTGRTLRDDLTSGAHSLVKGIGDGEQVLAVGGAATSGLQVRTDEIAIGLVGATPHAFRPAAAEVLP